MPYINWESLCSETEVGNEFLDFCIESALYQHVVEPTHKSDSLLDLLFCNDLSFRRISSVHIRPPLSTTCNHSVIEFILEMEDRQKLSSNIPLIRQYNLGNYELINRHLISIDWNAVFINPFTSLLTVSVHQCFWNKIRFTKPIFRIFFLFSSWMTQNLDLVTVKVVLAFF